MKYIAYEYEKYAERFSIDNHPCALMLDMGLGKTVITLTSIRSLLINTVKATIVGEGLK